VIENKVKSKQNRLAKENYEFKLVLKAFNGLVADFFDCVQRPKAFRRAAIMQKAFIQLKPCDQEYGTIDEEEIVTKYRQVSNI
jgi:hypothetical protein